MRATASWISFLVVTLWAAGAFAIGGGGGRGGGSTTPEPTALLHALAFLPLLPLPKK